MKKFVLKNVFGLFSADSNGIPLSITSTTTTITTEPQYQYVPANGCICSINIENDGSYVLAFCNNWTDELNIYWCYIVYPSSSCSDHNIFEIDTSINMAKAQCYIKGIQFLLLAFT